MIGPDLITSVRQDMTRRIVWMLVEGAASTTTLAGIYLGSTTLYGASCYLASLPFWVAIMIGKNAWGLLPLNVFTLIVTILNLVKALR